MSYTMTIRMDAQLLERLEETAKRKREPVSTLARKAIIDWLDRQAPKRASTLLRAAGSLSGRGTSATNESVRAAFRRRK